MFKGSLEQVAAFAFNFYDTDSSGLLSTKEVMQSIKILPVGGPAEQDLLALMAFFEGKKAHFTFMDYLEYAQSSGMHRGVEVARKIINDPE